MARYKLIQDIEAEDHILGPLSFRQFIYGLIAAFCLYMCYFGLTKHLDFILLIFLPAAIFFGFFAFPWGRDQPTELWALAIIRFLFKPHRRVWDQSSLKELVTITVPKKIERQLTDNLSPNEVKGRLKALASTLDSRGWVVKGINVNLYGYQSPQAVTNSDRLVTMDNLPQNVPDYDIKPSDDVLDASSNPAYQQLNQMVDDSEKQHRDLLIRQMNEISQPASPTTSNQWFIQTPSLNASGKAADDLALAQKLRDKMKGQQIAQANLRTLDPVVPGSLQASSSDDPAILSLAGRDDLKISTLAREADKANETKSSGEVVINLQ